MKKLFLIFGSFLLMFVLMACDGEGDFTLPEDTTLPTTEITTTEEATTGDETTEEPTTQDGTTEEPTTQDGTTEEPTTEEPTTEEPTTDPSEPAVLLDEPTNLSIDGMVLYWDEVADAEAYSVYVDGNFQAEVSGTQFDFSSIVEDYMVFNVRALAEDDASNSDLSLDIVYNANAESEISDMQTFMDSSEMNVTDNQAFATELVLRGMTVSEMQTMMTNMEPVMTKMQNGASMSEIYPDLHTLLNDLDHKEALVSAMVRVEMPNMIQAQIDAMTAMNENPDFNQTSILISEDNEVMDYSSEIEDLNRLLLFVETYPDEVVESAMIVIDYLMRVENEITSQWVEDLDTVIDSASQGPFEVNLAVSVKNGLVMNFKDEMPSLNDLTIFNQTMMTFTSVMLDDDRMESFITAEKTAMQMQITMELFFDALLQIDADYINQMQAAMDTQDELEILKLQIAFINDFIDSHDEELSELEDVYSDEEKEDIFFDLMVASVLEMQGLTETEQADIMTIIKANIDFDDLLALKTLSHDLFNDLLDEIIANDYGLVEAIYEMRSLTENEFYYGDDDSGDDSNFLIMTDLEPGDYLVSVFGFSSEDVGEYDIYIYADYGTGDVLIESNTGTLEEGIEDHYTFTLTDPALVTIYTEGSLDTYGTLQTDSGDEMDQTELMLDLLDSLVTTINPLVQDMTDTEYALFIDNILSFAKTSIEIENYHYSTYTEDQLTAIDMVFDTISNTSPEQLDILQATMNQIEIADIFTEIYNIYYVDEELANPELHDYGVLIEFANLYVDTYDLVETDIDDLLTDVLSLLDDETIQMELDITSSDVADIKAMISAYPDDLYTQAMIVIDYDYRDLSQTEIEELQELIMLLESPLQEETQVE
ncbi:MAG: hypothetical protein ACLFPM_05490 [Candidatus Izemoplasmatales bacterium]